MDRDANGTGKPRDCSPYEGETDMADDKTHVGAGDRERVTGEQDHELRQFAATHGLSYEQVRQLVERVGNSRPALEAAVQMMER
jgi:hypothetical protein